MAEAHAYIKDNILSISGILDFDNAMAIHASSSGIFKQGHESIVIDFSGLMSANSVVLAMIVSWIKLGAQHNARVIFQSVSQDVMSLAKVSGLDAIIQCD